MRGLLSVIVPAYNEQATVSKAAEVIAGVLERAEIEYELIFVDDGSTDATWARIREACENNPHVRGVSFSRNFGKDQAVFAGLSRAAGSCCAVLDCDLQHPPEKLVEMYALWQQGFEVVEGLKVSRGREPLLHRLAVGAFYVIISRAAGFDMRQSSDFKLIDRKVADVLLSLPEQEVFFRGLTAWVGFKTAKLEFFTAERTAGESKWSFLSLVRYALSGITSFSTAPLLLALPLGILAVLAALLAALFCGVFGAEQGGWQLFFAVMGLAALGCLLMCLGILGYYVARIYRQSLGRPRFIISDECGKVV